MNAGDREPAIEAVLADARSAVSGRLRTDAGQAVPESPAGPDFSVRVTADDGRPAASASNYDSFAEAYTAETEANLINGYYTRPAVLELAGDVAGRRILDVGCGSGPLSAALRDRGAVVTRHATGQLPASAPRAAGMVH
jgi:predicted TPR repeat methyltransferase